MDAPVAGTKTASEFFGLEDRRYLSTILKNRVFFFGFAFSYEYYKEGFHKVIKVHRKDIEDVKNKNAAGSDGDNFVREQIEVAVERFVFYQEEQGRNEDRTGT